MWNVPRPHCRGAAGAFNRACRSGAPYTSLLSVVAAVLVGLCAAGCSDEKSKAEKPEQEAVKVTITPAKSQGVQRNVEVVGTLFGKEDVIISNKVPGKVVAIYKDIGDRVAPGEPLAQLLKNDYQLSLNEKRSQLQEALATLGVADVPPESFDPGSVPAVRRAKLEADNAKDKLERARQLHEAKPPLISDQEFADLQTQSQVAQSGSEAAMLVARSQVALARTRNAQVAIAEQALRDTTLRAPRPMTPEAAGEISGDGTQPASTQPAATQPLADASGDIAVLPLAAPPAGPAFAVVARFSSEGELNAGLTRMFRLVIDDPLKLRANVPERHAGQIQVGQPVEVRVESEDRAFPGTVTRINPQIDPTNRSFEVEVAVPNGEHALKPGGFVRSTIETFVEPNVLLVPEASVVSFAGVKKVYTVKDGKALEIVVDTGTRVDGWVEVVTPKKLKAGDPIVVEGVSRMSSGVPVTATEGVIPAAARTRPTSPRE